MALRFLNSGYFAGKVGIGTESPHNKLEISTSTNGDGLLLDHTTGSDGRYTGIYFKVDNNTADAYKKGGLVWERTGSYNEGRFHFLLNNENNANNVDLTDSKFTILSTGNVGIGTTTPNAKLDVQGTQGQLFSVTDDLSGEIFAVSDISGVPIMTVNSSGVSYFDGDVGIGTNNPGAKLHISTGGFYEVGSLNGSILIEPTGVAFDGYGAGIILGAGRGGRVSGGAAIASVLDSASDPDRSGLSFFYHNATFGDPRTEGMRLAASGKVGIGTTSPNAKLTVKGSGLTSQDFFHVEDSGGVRMVEITSDPAGNASLQVKDTSGSTQSLINSAGNSYLNGGNVGIGTTSPSEKLEVSGSNTLSIKLSRNNTDTTYVTTLTNNYSSALGTELKSGTYNILTHGNSTGTSLNFTNGVMTFDYRDSEQMRITSDGDVGINTTSPDFKLDVDGTFGVSDLPFNTDSVSVLVADETIGAELITNGDFATDSDWTKGTGTTISSGTANFSSADAVSLYQNIGTQAGYVKVEFTVTSYTSGTLNVYSGSNQSVANINVSANALGTYSVIVDRAGGNNNIIFGSSNTSNFTGSIDNVSVKLITSASNQIQKRELGTGAFGPTPVGAYLPLTAGSGSPLTGDLYIEEDSLYLLNASNNYWRVQNNSSGKLTFKQGTTQRGIWSSGELQLANNLIVDNKIGVGTTSPQAFTKVDVRSGYANGDAAIAGYGYNGVGGFGVMGHAYAVDNTHAGSATGLRGISNGGRTVSGSVNIGGYFTAAGSESNYALITDSGNVGIGTPSPNEKLDVDGGIAATGINYLNQSNQYNNSTSGITGFGNKSMEASISYYDTGKNLATAVRGIVWTGKHYIVTDYIAQTAKFYNSSFDAINNTYGSSISLPNDGNTDHPHGAAWDGRYLYVIQYTGSGAKIVAYDLDNGTGTATIVFTQALQDTTATYDVEYAEGHLYTVANGKVSQYKLEGKTITHVQTSANILDSLEAQAITYDGSYLWITQNGYNVYQVRLDCTLVGYFNTGVPPNNIGWAWNGQNIASVNHATGDVYIINTASTRFDTEKFLVMGGDVGIGEEDPICALHVLDSDFPQVRINDESANGDSGIRFRSYSDDGAGTIVNFHADIFANGSTGSNGRLGFRVPYNSEAMTILSTGAVGINNTNPPFGLTLSKNIDAGGMNTGVLLGLESSTLSDPAGYRMKSQDSGGTSRYYQVLYNGDEIEWKNFNGSLYSTRMSLSNSGSLNVISDITTGTANISSQNNTDIDTGAEVVAQVSTQTYTAAFFDFVVKKGTNVRSGTVYACHDGTNVEFTETSTQDLGDTSDVVLSVDKSGFNLRLIATVASDDWSVKSLIRAI